MTVSHNRLKVSIVLALAQHACAIPRRARGGLTGFRRLPKVGTQKTMSKHFSTQNYAYQLKLQ